MSNKDKRDAARAWLDEAESKEIRQARKLGTYVALNMCSSDQLKAAWLSLCTVEVS